MASLEEAIVYRLKASTAVSALAGTRGYAYGEVPTGAAYPYWTYRRASTDRPRALDDVVGLANTRLEITAISDGLDEAEALAAAIRNDLDNAYGNLGNPADSCNVRGISAQSDSSEFSPPVDASDAGLQWIPLAFSVWFSEQGVEP